MGNRNGKTRNIIGIALGILIVLVVWSMASAMSSRKKPDDNKHLGIAEYEKGNYQEAIEYYNKGIEVKPGDSCLYNNLGLAYYALRKYDEAISEYSKAIELKPDFADAYFNRGQACWRKGGYNKTEFLDKAVSDFNKVIESNPDDMEAYYNRGLAYSSYMHWHKKKITNTKRSGFTPEATQNFVKALFDFQKVIDSDSPYSALAIAGKANLFYRHANWEVAIMEYKKAIERKDEIIKVVGKEGYGGMFAPMGRTYMALKDMENAYLSYKKFMDLVPNPLSIFHEEGPSFGMGYAVHVAQSLKKYEKAIKWYDRRIAIAEQPTSRDYFSKGFCYYKLKEFDKAIDSYNKGLDLYASGKTPEQGYGASEADARKYLGMIHKERGDIERAEREFHNAIRLYSKKKEPRERKKEVKERKKESKEDRKARKEQEEMLRTMRARAKYEGRGLCYLEIGEYDKAISDFEKIRESKRRPQNYITAQKNIGVSYLKMGDKEKAKQYFEKTIELAEGYEKKKDEYKEIIEETENLLNEI
ncbi:MAG: hypothetical protein SRB2_03997 [Desulfobacteraceae bacterium Eth-SRB2]|nr:MAG: hypothetical protein SRB2_03997 [Desulfobacteraceae bacterium Eth-SRB2]